MKKFFVLTFIVLFATAVSYAQGNIFIINGEKIENFDGSQLTGKKILSFIVIKNDNGDIYNVHTDDILPDSLKNRPLKVTTKVQHVTPKALFVVDGKEYSGSIKDIKPGDISSINVYKAGSDVANSYGDKGKNGVVKIFTRANKENILYVVDGKSATSQEVKDIDPSKISNIVVLKRGSKAAMDHGEIGKTHDICIIKTE